MIAKEGKGNRRGDHTFVLPAECLLCFILCLFFAWLILSGKGNRQITRNLVKTTQEQKRPDTLTAYFLQNLLDSTIVWEYLAKQG